MTKQIYVTPYNLETKQCTAPSSAFAKGDVLSAADAMFSPGMKSISQSDRLVLISSGEFGLAVSDYVISAEPAA